MSLQYLIDTDWVVHYFKGRQAIVKRLDALENESLAISVATLAELYDGLYGARDPRKREADLQDFLQWVTVLGLDEETCRLFGKERSRLRQAGNLPGDIDLLIGATALRHGLAVLNLAGQAILKPRVGGSIRSASPCSPPALASHDFYRGSG